MTWFMTYLARSIVAHEFSQSGTEVTTNIDNGCRYLSLIKC